jgi:PAS domain S-box-containing protein
MHQSRRHRVGANSNRSKQELPASSLYARSLIEASLDPLVTINPQGKITDVNQATEQVTGIPREQLIGSDFSDYFTDAQKAREGYQTVLSQGFVKDYPLTIRHALGPTTDVLYNATVYRNEAGVVQGVFAAAHDVTERRQAEAARQQLAAIVESSDDAITGKTLDGIITSWNRAAERVYGYRAEEIIGKPISILSAPDRPNEVPEILDRIRRRKRVAHYETVRARKDGSRFPVSLTVSPIEDASGNIVGASTITRDISQSKRLEEELRTASLYARSLIEASLDPLVTISPDGKITDVNEATESATGRSRLELIGSDFSDYFTEPDRARAGYQKVIQEGLVKDYPLTIRHFSGHTMDVLYNATVYRNEANAVQGVFAAARDVTKRKQIEEELRSTSLYARSLIEASLDPLVTISHDGKIMDVNRATEEATGIDRNRLIGTDFSNYFTEPEKARQGYRRVLRESLVHDYPLTIRNISGRAMDVLYNAAVYRNETGAVQGVFAAARDITERKAAEKRQSVTNALTELFARNNSRKEYLNSTVEVIRDWSGCHCVGIRVVDSDGCIPYEACVGFDSEFQQLEGCLSLTGDACFCIRAVTQSPDEQDRPVMTPGGSFCCADTLAFAQTLTSDHQNRYRGTCIRRGFKSLAIVPIQYREQVLAAIHLADECEGIVTPGKVEFIESFAPLIGEAIHRFNAEAELARHREHLEELVKQRTLELRRAADELARSNRDLEQFAYVASHDLQEPLRAVAGFVGLLRHEYGEQLNGMALEYIDEASEGAKRMQTLIEDLLKYSRVGTQGIAFKTIDANDALREASANLRLAVQESGAVITNDRLPIIQADATQLAQLFQNLIGNAIRFCGPRKPGIHISAKKIFYEKSVVRSQSSKEENQETKDSTGSPNVVQNPELMVLSTETDNQHAASNAWMFTVQDNGIGIEPQYYERIFMIFQRLHSRSQYPGTGVGLAICKRIVERHGGRIWIQSQPGQGSTFYFTIPSEER